MTTVSDAEASTADVPDLSGRPQPSLVEFAQYVADQIMCDAYRERSKTGQALARAVSMISAEITEERPEFLDDPSLFALVRGDWRRSRKAWRQLREIRIVQLGGEEALAGYREERSSS